MAEKQPRKMWNEESMVAAMEAVETNKMSVTAAAATFNVPRKTLDDRVKGRVKHGTKPGPTTALTLEEENALVSYLVYMANRGFPLTRTMVKAFAWAIAKRSGNDGRFNQEYGPGEHWWANFRKRHPKLTLRKTDKLERSRAEALNPEVVEEYFKLLETTLDENGLKNCPRQIYNCDETFLPLDYSREKAVTLRGTKNVYCQAQGTTDHITLLCCASAAGLPLPPMIIYPKAFPGGQYRFEGPDDAVYAKSESGWVDSELFLTWLNKIFLKFSVAQRPVILFIDGHKSHVTLEVVDLCRKHNIILFCLPPHTTHALQPLDVAVFKSLKDHFSKSVHAVAFTKKDFIVSKREFSRVLRSPFECAFSIPNIKSGFRKSGIYPFNPDAVEKAKMIPSTLHSSSLNESSSDSSTPYPSSQSSCPPSQSSVASTSTEVASTSGISSVTSASTPSPTVSPWCSQSSLSSCVLTSTPIDPLASCSLPVTPSSPRMSSPIVIPLHLLDWCHLT